MILFFIGLPGSGKTTIGKAVYDKIKHHRINTVFLDGDTFRKLFEDDLDYSLEGRMRNLRRMLAFCKTLDEQKINVVCCVLSVFPDFLEKYRKNFTQSWVCYIDVDLAEIIERDQKGLFSNTFSRNVVGKDIDFLPPISVDVHIKNSKPFKNPSEIAAAVFNKLERGLDAISLCK